MELLIQLLIGTGMIAATVIVHALALDVIFKNLQWIERPARHFFKPFWKAVVSVVTVVSLFAVHVVLIWSWAGLYLWRGCQPLTDIAEAVYFATVTYTTLGYGDITLDPSCRMLSGVEAANGLILFGWTTAFIFEVITTLYRREAQSL
jgi:hypothetical protein